MIRRSVYLPIPYALFVILFLGLTGCSKPIPALKTFTGVIDNDSVSFQLRLYDRQFSGTLTYSSYGRIAKTGKIQGQISGDTLLGDFLYSAYGAQPKRIPLALLRTSQGYSLGKGVTSDYMGIPYFVKDVPIEYDTVQLLVQLE